MSTNLTTDPVPPAGAPDLGGETPGGAMASTTRRDDVSLQEHTGHHEPLGCRTTNADFDRKRERTRA